ncbi:protein of unknown function [Taphrina deformans PYCC 5710]|uniref:Succinate dehydrogenase assembly factor 2, mitochondrial n=1 Tax=Taphrina deformans (strain PYCC 5710 / ATCC 11124 / CBS 356.35 / IMI 108563 / JCM 9778 / NBRC 8474) TaxID=1097556 RepID=R4XF42_TAPDE|nr:protein of unknown function [Taphrina deformans PYCC 5710]|eukprot:CCG84263.1 protein of unknown function [Taphrina deformans PYCC 5710]
MFKSLRLVQRSARPLRTFSSARPSYASAAPQDPAGVFHKQDFTAQDPYPLHGRTNPVTMVDEGSVAMGEDLKPHAPIDRSHEVIETKRARLLWQSRKRGILETDLLLSTFAAKQLERMSMDELILYDQLLDEPDWEIYYYATSKKQPPEKFRGSRLIEDLIQHVKNEEKETRRMPSLKDQSANYRADRATDSIRTKQSMKSDEEPTSKSEEPQGDTGEAKVPADRKDGLKEKLKGEDSDPSVIAS